MDADDVAAADPAPQGDPSDNSVATLHAVNRASVTETDTSVAAQNEPGSTLPLGGLFEVTRMKRPIGLLHVLFWIYVPLGLVLTVLKLLWIASWELFFFRLGAYLHMNNLFFRIYCSPGLITIVRGREHLKATPSARILVSNHVSEMDSVACRAAFGACHAISPSYYSKFIFTRQMVTEMYPIYIDVTDRHSLHEKIQNTLKTSKLHILCFPEGCVTNGKGVMRYHKFLFSLGEAVTPVAIRVTRPFPIHMDTLCTPVWHNIIWLCLVPWQIWHMQVLPPMYPRSDESAEQFADRVQQATAKALGVPATPYMKKDKHKLVAQLLPQLRRRYRNRVIIGNCFKRFGGMMPWDFLGKPFVAIGDFIGQPPYDEIPPPESHAASDSTPGAGRGARRLPNALQC
ncbi:ancient ubiquitous protein 1 [Pelomyxa schiedti]|nr:ancient ubiquitous protein 1 [Pelomyxa schiedti]